MAEGNAAERSRRGNFADKTDLYHTMAEAVEGEPRVMMMRKGRLEDLDRSFDIEFWQLQDDSARFAAAWELVMLAQRMKGKDASQLRLQRTVETFRPLPG